MVQLWLETYLGFSDKENLDVTLCLVGNDFR